MAAPVVHFEVVGKDGKKLASFYSELFGWEINVDNPMNYGTVDRYTRGTAPGSAAGWARARPATTGT